jgi:hypothetical protein
MPQSTVFITNTVVQLLINTNINSGMVRLCRYYSVIVILYFAVVLYYTVLLIRTLRSLLVTGKGQR